MTNQLPGLLAGAELAAEYQRRSKPHDEKIVQSQNKRSLELKVAAEEEDGWGVLKSGKTTVRVKRNKPEDRLLEDDVWCLFYRMGFRALNKDRLFSIQVGKTNARQLDVFAKDDDTVFIVECTHAREEKAKSAQKLLDKIEAIRPEIIQAVHEFYGKEPKLKVKFAIATRNIIPRQADIDRAKAQNIPFITDADIDYFQGLTDILKTAARYQFLARYLHGEGVDGLRLSLPATRGSMGGSKFYSFLISPHDLLKISYISHRSKSNNDDLNTYQRLVKPGRLKDIAAYIDSGGKFPTNVVINLHTKNPLRFDQSGERSGDTETGTLQLPALYGSAWIIDGQHRLYGYAHSKRGIDDDKAVLPVLAFENMPSFEEVNLFIKINTEQVKVKRNLVNEILAGLNIDDPDPSQRLYALASKITLNLDALVPFKGRIKTEADTKSNMKCLSLASFVEGIKESNLLGTSARNSKDVIPGPLMDPSGDSKKSVARAVRILAGYFGLFSTANAAHWARGDAKGGYLSTNLGTRALLELMKRSVGFVASNASFNFGAADPEDFVETLSQVLKPLISFISAAGEGDFDHLRRNSSKQGVTRSTLAMMEIIYNVDPTFAIPELIEHLKNQDIEGTSKARDLIVKIEEIIFEDIIHRLQEKYGKSEKEFWMKGIPSKVRQECDRKFNENKFPQERWNEMSFSDYSDIITMNSDNWDQFKDFYNFLSIQKRSEALSWLGRLNRLRNSIFHPPRAAAAPLSRTEVQFIERLHGLVSRHIKHREKLSPRHNYLQNKEETQQAPQVLEKDDA